ncbi:MAG: aminotransferase class V-fold PLP-dependent enzyme [Candidatus Pacebacteria bacterium]|nr:aminotransferase class V-fold PLP-dependent enzyme [Candidatus Paceibacterota bacterium]
MKKVKLFKPFVSWYAVWNAVWTLRSGQLAEGPRVKEFEKEFGKKFNKEHICNLNSGTTALELAYELAGISEGDEVITPILTCTASNIPLARRKAKIIFADIEDDLNISVSDVEKKITPQTKAIVFVHFGGNNRGLKELMKIAEEKKITFIEDAAQAVGSDYWGKADFTCVSLQAIKTLTSGDGGILICKNPEHDAKARRLRWFGYDRDLKQKQGDTDLLEAGYKYHMNDVNAAIALGNLKVIDKIISHRKRLIAEYRKHGIDAHIWFATVFNKNRDELKKYLAENGIESGIYHYRNDKYTIFGGRKSFPNMDRLENEYLVLPLHHKVSVNDVRIIARVIDEFNSSHSS